MKQFVITEHANIVAIADAVRQKTGGTSELTLGDIIDGINSITGSGGIDTSNATADASEILLGETAYVNGKLVRGEMPDNGAISKTMDGINNKSVYIPYGFTSGGTVSLTDDIDNEVGTQSDLIAQIKFVLADKAAGGVELPVLENPGTASDLARYKQLIDGNGNVITGSAVSVASGERITLNDEPSEVTYGDSEFIYFGTTPFEFDYHFYEGSRVEGYFDSSAFGNAIADDVVEGTSFTSAAGLKADGAMKQLFSLDNARFEIDYEGDLVITLAEDSKRYVEGTQILYRNGEFLGLAKPEDVRAGVTFSSWNNIGMTGELEVGTPETWTLTLEDGSTVEKVVYVK